MTVNGTRISTADKTVIKHNVTSLHCLMVAILIVLTALINQIPLVARWGQILIQAIPGLVPPGLKPWYWIYFQWTFKGSGVLNQWLLFPVPGIMDITASWHSHDQNLVTWQPTHTYNHRGNSSPPTCLSPSHLCSDFPTLYWLCWSCAPLALLPTILKSTCPAPRAILALLSWHPLTLLPYALTTLSHWDPPVLMPCAPLQLPCKGPKKMLLIGNKGGGERRSARVAGLAEAAECRMTKREEMGEIGRWGIGSAPAVISVDELSATKFWSVIMEVLQWA